MIEDFESGIGGVAADETSGDEVVLVCVEEEDASVNLEKLSAWDGALQQAGEVACGVI